MKLLIATPHANNLYPEYAGRLAFTLRRLPREWTIELFMRYSGILSVERNNMFARAQKIGADYLMFIDSDMVFPLDGIERLIGLQKDIATGLAVQRARPFRTCVYQFAKDCQVHSWIDPPHYPFKVDACGTGFMLISKKVLDHFTPAIIEKWGQPFNIANIPDHPESFQLSEDISFCLRLYMMGGFEIWCDPSVYLGHIDRGQAHYYEHHRFVPNKFEITYVNPASRRLKYRCSVMIPSRGRVDALRSCLQSLSEKATEPEMVEVLIRYDADDDATHTAIGEICQEFPMDVCPIVGPSYGYAKTNLNYEEMAQLAHSDWWLLFNDDAKMLTQGWDMRIGELQDIVLYKTQHNHPEKEFNVFPVVPRKLYDCLGSFGLSNHIDTWLTEVCKPLGMERDIDIELLHDRADLTGNNVDDTFRKRTYTQYHFWSDAMHEARLRDRAKLQARFQDKDENQEAGVCASGSLGLE